MARISTLQLSTVILFLLCLGVGHSENASEKPRGEETSSASDEDGIYKLVGETLTLNCTVPEASGYDAEDLVFILYSDIEGWRRRQRSQLLYNGSLADSGNSSTPENERIVPSENLHIISSKILQMNLTVSNEKDAGVYVCFHNTAIGDSDYKYEKTVYVEKPLREVQNISCFVYNWEEALSCTWEQGESYYNNHLTDITVNVTLTPFRFIGREPITDPSSSCPSATPLYTTACVWDYNHFRAAATYLLGITVANERRPDIKPAVKQLFLRTGEIVKPAPVTDLRVVEKNSTCVIVAWNHSRIHRGKYYRVCIGTCRDQSSPEVTEMDATLCGFRPNTSYNITVQCHPSNGKGFWSDTTSITVTTAEAEPESSFQVQPGSYSLHPCSGGKRNAIVFWKSVPPEKRNGEIIGYRLIINGSVPIDVNVSSPTSALIPKVPCDVPIDVRIFARTRVGPSKTNSRITLYPEPGPLFDLAINTAGRRAVAVWNGTNGIPLATYNMSDDTDADSVNVTNIQEEPLMVGVTVTIFWCAGNIQEKMCEGEVQWIDGTETGTAEIPLGDREPTSYLFGISTAGQAISWTDCLFQEEAPKKAPSSVEVQPGSSPGQLNIQWRGMVCSYSYPYRIVGYRLNICETVYCDETKYKSFQVSGADSFYHVVELEPGKEYNATVQAVTATGKLGPASEPGFGIAKPVQEVVLPMWVIGIICAAVLLVLLFACCYCKRRMKDQNSKFTSTVPHVKRPRPRRPSRRYTDVPSSPSIIPTGTGSGDTGLTFVDIEDGVSEPEDNAEDPENSAESMIHNTESAPRTVSGADDYLRVEAGSTDTHLGSLKHADSGAVQPPAALQPSGLFGMDAANAVSNSCQGSQNPGYLPPGSLSSDTRCNNAKAAHQSAANQTVNTLAHIDTGTMKPLAHGATGTVYSASGCVCRGVKPLGKDAGKIQMIPLQPMLQAASPQKGGEINPFMHAATGTVNCTGDCLHEGVNSAFDSPAIACLPESPSVLSEDVSGQSPEDYLKCEVVPRNPRYNLPTQIDVRSSVHTGRPSENRNRRYFAFDDHSALEEAALRQGTENLVEVNLAFDDHSASEEVTFPNEFQGSGGQPSPDKSEDSAKYDIPFMGSHELSDESPSDESPSDETAMLGTILSTPQQAPTEGQSRGYVLHSTVPRTERSPADRSPEGNVADYVQLGDR